MLTLFSVSMFAAEPVTVKSTFTKATKPENNQVTDLEGKVTWDIATTVGQGEPTYATGQSNSVEAIKFGASKSVYFSKVEFSTDYFKDYNVTSVNFYVANNGKKTGTLTVKQGSVTIGTSSAEFGNAWTEMTATGTKGEGGSLTVTYEVEQAFYLSYIEVTYEAAGGGDDPAPTTRTLYCKVAQSWWKADGAAVGIYAFKGEEHNAAWPGERMTLAENETEVWTATIDAKYEKVIFVRVNASGNIADWGAKTADLTLADAGENDLYTVTSSTAVWGDPGVTGEWSKYSPSEPPAPAEPDSIYFVNVKGWDNPRVHLWGGTAGETKWPGVEMTKVSAEADGGAPAAARGVKLIKMDETAKINGYDVYKYVADKGAYAHCIFSNNGADQTADLDWTSDSYFYDGAWYADEEEIPAPAAPKYHIAGGWTDWKLVGLAVATDEETATYKAELAKGDYEFKIVRTVGTDTTWLTKANAGQAYGLHREWVGVADVKDQADENLKVTADEGGKYVFTWTFANDSIGITFPAKRAFNETWGVDAETAVAAGTKYVDNFAVTIETVYATTLKTNARKFDSYAFTHAIQVRNAAYPSAETPAGTEQSGSTSLVITAKEDVDLTFFYNRQTTSESTGDAESNDNKDMKVFDQAAPTTALEAEFRVVWMQEDKKYVNAVKTISLVKGHTYTVSAKGTTIQLSGIRYATDAEAPVANYFIVGNAEVFGGWSTFIPVYEETFEVENLAAGDYAFRLCMNDGEWTDDYGFAQLTVKPEGVSTDDHNNICFKLKEASNLKVTYKPAAGGDAAVFTVEANFYVPAKKDLYLVPNQWAEADAKIAAWVWNKEYTINAFTEFFAPKAEGNDTLVAKVFAEADSIIFVRFNKDAAEPNWNGGEGYQWNQTPNDSIQWDKAVFTIVPGGDYYSNGTWDPYVAPVPVLADGFYLIGQKGWDVAALSADLLFAANPDNEGEYQLTVTLVKDEGIKVVRVESDVIKQWYPDGEGNEYKVDDAHAGQKTIYFKPDYVADWAAFGGYIYIEANQPTGLDQLAVDAKAVKAIIGGQLFIIRNGKTYTAQGVMVR